MTVNEVFADAMREFKSRLQTYMPLKATYTMQNRVIISNVRLTSIFGFLSKFFVLGEEDAKDVETLTTEWVVAARFVTFDMLVAPTNKVGMATPLQDIFKLNVAGVLARQENLPEPAPIAPFYQVVDGSSMLMSDHVLKALSLVRHVVEITFFGIILTYYWKSIIKPHG